MSIEPLPARDWTQGKLVPGLLLTVLILAAYSPAMTARYVWDDHALFDNPLIASWRGLWDIWSRPSANPHEAHYWPLVYTSFWIEHKFWGFAPFGYHLVNILLHATGALLLWALLRRGGVPDAWWGAALYALHPVHVESVAWVIERKDMLMAAFFFGGMLAWARFDETRSRRAYAATVFLLLCAMWSKSAAVCFPVAAALWSWWKRGSLEKRDALTLAPLFALTVALAALDLAVTRRTDAAAFDLSFAERILIAGQSVWFYLGKLVWPHPLTPVYPRWESDVNAAADWLRPVGVAVVLIVLWTARRKIGRAPFAVTLFYLAALAPTLGFIDFSYMRHSFVADRFQHLASAAPLALAAGAVARSLTRFADVRRAAAAAGAAALFLCAGLTFAQSRHWRSLETLFAHATRVHPDSALAFNNYGSALLDGDRFAEAEAALRRAVAIDPDFAKAWNNLGLARLRQNDPGEAARHFQTALRHDEGEFDARINLAAALSRQGRHDEAEREYRAAIERDPRSATARNALGLVYMRLNDMDRAMEQFAKAAELDPAYAEPLLHIGRIHAGAGELQRAAEAYAAALAIRPHDGEILYNFGRALAQAGQLERAVELYRAALNDRPGHWEAHNALGAALCELGRLDEGIAHFEEALRLNADFHDARENLQTARAALLSEARLSP